MNLKRRNFLNKFHVYGGLFTAGFLISFSYSAFYHQHHLKYPKPGDKITHWEQQLTIPDIPDKLAFKLAVRDSMGLFGHAPWWEDYNDSLGIHHFMIARPGKKYWITVPEQGNIFKVEEVRTGFWDVLFQLHPLSGGMSGHGKGPFFIKAWRMISFPMALVLFGVMLITIHFWYARSFHKRRSWIIVGVIASFPFILIIFIWLVG
jgi:hypothetical protein